MRKICIVVTARPSYARIKSVMKAIKNRKDVELQLVVAASALLERYGSAVKYMKADGFEPDKLVYMVLEGENLVTAAKSTGLGIVELATVFDNLNPDVVISVADRYETIATAISATYLNIPLAHTMGGEVSGTIDESIRHAITKFSHIHFPASKDAAERIKKLGEKEDSIFVKNIDGPLNHLTNNWLFIDQNNKTEVTFDIDFEIKNKFLNTVMEASFKFGLEKIADAFQKRAEDLFNNSKN